MKECPNCNFLNLDDARDCVKCRHHLVLDDKPTPRERKVPHGAPAAGENDVEPLEDRILSKSGAASDAPPPSGKSIVEEYSERSLFEVGGYRSGGIPAEIPDRPSPADAHAYPPLQAGPSARGAKRFGERIRGVTGKRRRADYAKTAGRKGGLPTEKLRRKSSDFTGSPDLIYSAPYFEVSDHVVHEKEHGQPVSGEDFLTRQASEENVAWQLKGASGAISTERPGDRLVSDASEFAQAEKPDQQTTDALPGKPGPVAPRLRSAKPATSAGDDRVLPQASKLEISSTPAAPVPLSAPYEKVTEDLPTAKDLSSAGPIPASPSMPPVEVVTGSEPSEPESPETGPSETVPETGAASGNAGVEQGPTPWTGFADAGLEDEGITFSSIHEDVAVEPQKKIPVKQPIRTAPDAGKKADPHKTGKAPKYQRAPAASSRSPRKDLTPPGPPAGFTEAAAPEPVEPLQPEPVEQLQPEPMPDVEPVPPPVPQASIPVPEKEQEQREQEQVQEDSAAREDDRSASTIFRSGAAAAGAAADRIRTRFKERQKRRPAKEKPAAGGPVATPVIDDDIPRVLPGSGKPLDD